MKDISIIIPSYNNLRHLKNCYHSFRRWYPEVELILIDDGSDDGTWEWLKSKYEEDENLLPMKLDERCGISVTYDEGIESANNNIVGIIHADMLVTKNTFENMLKHLEKGTVVCATRIEPPLHPAGNEKIIKDFGMDFDSLDVPAFEQFAERRMKENEDETTNGMFAPWIIHKEDYDRMGGHDNTFFTVYEDSDIFQRWMLEGYELIQSRDAFVYHLTCRGHRWNEEIGKNDDGYEELEQKDRKNYIRKWGSWVQNDNNQHPIIFPKYDIGFVIKNCSSSIFNLCEMWCSDIYVDDTSVADNLLSEVDEFEKELISEKLHSIDDNVKNDVVIEFDGKDFKTEHYNQLIIHIQRIIDERTEPNSEFEWEIFNIKVGEKEPFDKKYFNDIYKKEL